MGTRHDPEIQTQRIVAFITGYVKQYGYSPTYQEIADTLDLHSRSLVHFYIRRAITAGKLTNRPGIPHTIRPAVTQEA